MLINIAEIDPICKVLGPGKRYVIWVQGCLKRCKGCYNLEFQPLKENKILEVENIKNDILKYKDKIEGVTFLGGEPLLQAAQLAEIAMFCKENDLTVLCYTGYNYDEVKNKKNVKKLFEYVDVLIDGNYDEKKKINTGFKGSYNQKTIFFTKQYSEKDFEKENSFEITIKDSKLRIKGFYK